MSTFLPLVVFLIMTLVMCPSILAGTNYKAENDELAANMGRMPQQPDNEKVQPVSKSYEKVQPVSKSYEKVLPVSKSYEDSNHIVDEWSMNSVRSYRSNHSDSPRDTKTVLEEFS